MTLQNLLSLIMFVVSEQALITWSGTGDGIRITAEVTVPLGEQPFTNGVKWFYWQPVPKDEKEDEPGHVTVQVFNSLIFSLQNSRILAKIQMLVF